MKASAFDPSLDGFPPEADLPMAENFSAIYPALNSEKIAKNINTYHFA